MSAADPHSILHTGGIKHVQPERGLRYRPGQAPHFVRTAQPTAAVAPPPAEAPPVLEVDRLRMQRMGGVVVAARRDMRELGADTDDDDDSSSEGSAVVQADRERHVPTVVQDAPVQRRRVLSVSSASSQSERPEGTSSDDDSDKGDLPPPAAGPIRPLFKPKGVRGEVRTLEQVKWEEDALLESRAEREGVEKTVKAKALAQDLIAQPDVEEGLLDANYGLCDAPDWEGEGSWSEWVERELRRQARDREGAEARAAEAAETLRRRDMTDEELKADDERLREEGVRRGERERGKFQFMQKYYHQGAFYQDEKDKDKDHIYNRDYQQAVDDDK